MKKDSMKELGILSKDIHAELRLLNTIIENSPDGIQILNLQGFILYSNKAIKEMFGYSNNALIGKHMSLLNADPEFVRNVIIPRVLETGKWEGELFASHKNGSNIPVWLAAFTYHDEKKFPAALVVNIKDITKLKNREIALKQSQKYYNNLFHHSGDAIFTYDMNGKILNANKKALELFGYTENTILFLTIFDLFPDNEINRFRTIFKKVLKNSLSNTNINFMRNDKTTFLARFSSSLNDTEKGKIILGIVNQINRHNRKKDDNKYKVKLETLSKERTLDLLEANESLQIEIMIRKQAERKLLEYQKQLQWLSSQLSLVEEREKRKIASELHDCIGQTLALIKIKLGLLGKSSDPDEFRNIIKEIIQLIEQTIKETRTLTFELSPPILYELGLSKAIQWLVDQFKEKYGIVIIYNKNHGHISVDNSIRFIIFQAVRELLINIVKHAQSTQAMLSISSNNNGLKIVVEDNGVGFSLSPTSQSGYGLFYIRERMNQINGRFDIKSTPGRGTRITVIAPYNLSTDVPFERSPYEKNSNLIG